MEMLSTYKSWWFKDRLLTNMNTRLSICISWNLFGQKVKWMGFVSKDGGAFEDRNPPLAHQQEDSNCLLCVFYDSCVKSQSCQHRTSLHSIWLVAMHKVDGIWYFKWNQSLVLSHPIPSAFLISIWCMLSWKSSMVKGYNIFLRISKNIGNVLQSKKARKKQ